LESIQMVGKDEIPAVTYCNDKGNVLPVLPSCSPSHPTADMSSGSVHQLLQRIGVVLMWSLDDIAAFGLTIYISMHRHTTTMVMQRVWICCFSFLYFPLGVHWFSWGHMLYSLCPKVRYPAC
jgi:hypothetical protein